MRTCVMHTVALHSAGFESGGDYLFNISAASGVVESVASVESVSVER